MTASTGALGAVQSEAWREFYQSHPGSTWQVPELGGRSLGTAALTTVAVGLLLSSPNGSELAASLSRLPQSSTISPHNAVIAPTQVQPLPSAGEQLAAIQSTFGLNKSQLAAACAVTRQTIYDWYAGNFEPEGTNAERVSALYRLARMIRRSGFQPVPSKATDRPLPNGKSLFDLLSDHELDARQIHGGVAQLQSRTVPAESALDVRKRLGWAATTDEQRQDQLESNLDSFLDG
jgi:DNA-binding XRE family transcriptional regulator